MASLDCFTFQIDCWMLGFFESCTKKLPSRENWYPWSSPILGPTSTAAKRRRPATTASRHKVRSGRPATAVIMAVVLVIMLAVAGLPLRTLCLLAVVAGLLLLAAVEVGPKIGLLHGYQFSRLGSFLEQDSKKPSIQQSIWNVKQSKLAIGAGGLHGQGLGNGSQTNNGYVPEQQTDFIFSAVGEQLGFIGSTLLLGLLAVISWRLLRAAQLAR